MKRRFQNRVDAGRQLASVLRSYAGKPGVLVLGLARGGVPVAREVATRLNAAFDVLVARKLGVPCQEELAMGAIAPGGVCVLNDDVIDGLDIGGDVIGAVRLQQEQELERREGLYRGQTPAPDVQGRTVIVVDDGIATGSTMHAAVVYLRQQNAGRVVVAAPVIAVTAARALERMADAVVAVTLTPELRAIGAWYDDFSPTTDEDVRRILGTAAAQPLPSSS